MRKDFPTYEEAKKIIRENGIKTVIEYKKRYREFGLPSRPTTTYTGYGWMNWVDFLSKKSYLSYEDAQKTVLLNLVKTRKQYRLFYKEYGLPSSPNVSYKGKGWVNWSHFLFTASFPSYEEARTIVIENKIKTLEQYNKNRKLLGLPSHPNVTYKGKGWIDYNSFFGKTNRFFANLVGSI